ncbi:MAG: hypothetical protein K6B40_06865 [Firmicutes bacterium]|nr:hypothetical protein [Bacillota bacterium]
MKKNIKEKKHSAAGVLLLAALLGFGLCACSAPPAEDGFVSGSDITPPPASATDLLPEYIVSLAVDESQGDTVAQIPRFDIEGKSLAIADINGRIEQELQTVYNDFTAQQDGESWLEMKTALRPVTGYAQALTWYNIYPSYGTDGCVYSYVYDLGRDAQVTVEEAMEMLQLSPDSLLAATAEALSPGQQAVSAVPAACLFRDGSSPEIYYYAQVETEGADAWTYIYCYQQGQGAALADLSSL